jgi:hypothetical protein
MYRGYASDPGYWIGAIVVGALFFAVAAPIALAVGFIWVMKKVYDAFYPKEVTQEQTADVEENARSEAAARNNFRKHVNIGAAAMDVWFHPAKGVARPVLRIRNKRLAERMGGEKFNLAEIAYRATGDEDEVVAKAASAAKAMLKVRAR